MAERERGAAAVEMAIMAVFLLILLAGTVDVGRAIFTRIALEDAAQAAASYAALADPVSVAGIKSVAIDSTGGNPELVDTDITVSCYLDSGTSRDVRLIRVDVSIDQDLVTPGFNSVAGPVTISASATAERYVDNLPAPSGADCIPTPAP